MTLFSPVIHHTVYCNKYTAQFVFNLVDSGEKMGYGVTILLSLVVYIDFIQSNVPVWEEIGSAARIIWLFIVSIVGPCIRKSCMILSLNKYYHLKLKKPLLHTSTVVSTSILLSAWTISMHLISDDHVFQYGKMRATCTYIIAVIFNTMTCGWCNYDIPILVKHLSSYRRKGSKLDTNSNDTDSQVISLKRFNRSLISILGEYRSFIEKQRRGIQKSMVLYGQNDRSSQLCHRVHHYFPNFLLYNRRVVFY